MASEDRMTAIVEDFKLANAEAQSRIAKCFVARLRKVPERKRPAVRDAPIANAIDVRLDMFAQAYWTMHHWPIQGWGIPETTEPVTTLEGLSRILPGLLANDIQNLQGVVPPQPKERLDQYIVELSDAVLARSEGEPKPDSLPKEWEALIRLTGTIASRDLLRLQIPEIWCTRDIADVVPETLQEVADFALSFDDEWDVTAGFVLGLDDNGYCHYIYCRNAEEDASEADKTWEWRVACGGITINGDTREYVGDLAGFLLFYANIIAEDEIDELIETRVGQLERLNL
ncbi:hypothetical protein JX266_006899 [Neoarthrinium moseri]|nr:hypothetical protein JX266_006899 [Neoarthrinium moseri]